MTELATQRCRPLEGQPPMSTAEVTQQLARTPGWALADGAIQKNFDFADYHHTMAFVNAVARVAHVEDHHPELVVSYNRCTVRFNTHSVGGISVNDFICAAKVDALLP
ncbi:4a-hydroxytetrahydrobiopterin dehydratase [Rhodoferax sp.]|uniref:4a-hydroxytetrahydrobiopterin dehydratase n=1 Tax=Rhodoferax sp. TaxID=50421 RepID=UPI00274A9815|nr:4a-hydroxytetrahydrobiopterin dehydratase [Rhodoferax sp.]